MKHDLRGPEDVRTLVDAFYAGMEDDPEIGSFFAGLDWPAHLPTMVAFWSSIAFQTGAYRGSPFESHTRLAGLEARHFARWVDRFVATVDAHFAGEVAERLKARALEIAALWQMKLGLGWRA